MYNAEVLSKFPVVQHFPFGSLFSWDTDPNAQPPPTSIHASSQPFSLNYGVKSTSTEKVAPARPLPSEGTKAPWASASAMAPSTVPEPFRASGRGPTPTHNTQQGGLPPRLSGTSLPAPVPPADIRAPMPTRLAGPEPNIRGSAASNESAVTSNPDAMPPPLTRAPWAK